MPAVTGTPTSASSALNLDLTWNHTNPSDGNCLIVITVQGTLTAGDRVCNGVTYNGDSLDNLWTIDDGVFLNLSCWRRVNPDVGTDLAVVVDVVNPDKSGAGAVSISGYVGEGTPATGTDTTTPPNPNADVSSASGALVIAGCASDSSFFTSTTGNLQWSQENIDTDICVECATYDGAASVALSWTPTTSGNNWCIGGISLTGAGISPLTIARPTRRPRPFAPGLAR